MDMGAEIQRFCITDLPDDYLYLIFGKLDESLDRESFGLTCHRFLHIQNSSRKRLDLGKSNKSTCKLEIDSSKVDNLLKRFRQLEFLSLSRCVDVSDSGLKQLQICGSKLHSVCLDWLSKVTDEGLSYIASGCPLLSVIRLTLCEVTDEGLKMLTESCKHLKDVYLACCYNITDCGVQTVIQSCRQLRTLNVDGSEVTDVGFQWGSPTLEEIDIHACYHITDSGIRSVIQGCPQLRSLNITRCDTITGNGFQGCSPTLACVIADHCVLSSTGIAEMLSGGGLEYLSLAFSKCIERNGLATIGLGHARNLKVLDFKMCDFVTDDVILSISQGCPVLQDWNLTYCSHISPSGYEPIGLYCQNLERIHLNGCDSFHNEAFVALVNGCKRLSVIHMSSCPKVSASVILEMETLRDDLKIMKREAKRTVPSWVFANDIWPRE